MRLLILTTLALWYSTFSFGQDRQQVKYDGSDLQNFINSIPNNSVVEFPDSSIIREEVLFITGKSNIKFNFNGFEIQANTDGAGTKSRKNMQRIWPRNRSHVIIENSNKIELNGLSIRGPHKFGGVGASAYVAKFEAQHALEILNSNNILIENTRVSNIYGDGVYIGKNSSDITIQNSIISSNGRQGIAITSGKNVIIRNNELFRIRRAHIDLEPNTLRDTIRNIQIIGNTFGKKRLKWVAAASGKGVVRDVTFKDNIINCPADIRIGNVKNKSKQGPYRFDNNRSTVPYGTKSGEIWRLINVNGFIANDNHIIAQKNRNMHLIRTTNCTNIELSNNTVPNGNSGIKQ